VHLDNVKCSQSYGCSTHEALVAGQQTCGIIELVQEKNKKGKLFNDIVIFLSQHGVVVINSSEIGLVKKVVGTLRDILWYIDGHHHVFDERAQAVLSIFFTPYSVQCSSFVKAINTQYLCRSINSFCIRFVNSSSP
jgi:hypothetical protein